jgi:hypothetical protein
MKWKYKNGRNIFKDKNWIWYFLFLLAGIDVIMQSARVLTMGLFFPDAYYQPGPFDLLFDWTILLLFGFGITYYGVSKLLFDPVETDRQQC